MSIDFTDFQTQEFPDPDAAREWLDDNGDLTPTQRRRVEAWIKSWDDDLARDHVDHLNKVSETISEGYTSLAEALEADCREAAEIPTLLKRGRTTAKEATQRLRELTSNRSKYLARLKDLTGSIERWEATSEAAPVERMRAMQQRFQVREVSPVSGPGKVRWRYGARSLTADVLRGEQR